MNITPIISVVVPVYNVEKYLPQCIESILAQSFTDFELLLIDDGTPDRSGEICEEYAKRDTRIRVFHQENGGISRARNVGIEEAIGNFITFIDSDDYVKADYLTDLYTINLQQPGRKGLIIGAFEKVFSDKIVPVMQQDVLLESAEISRLLTEFTNKPVLYAGSKLFCRHTITTGNIRFVPDVSCLEDLLFTLDYCLHADYIRISNLMNYCYRIGHSVEVLSVRISSYPSEFITYKEYLNRLDLYKKKFALTDADMMLAWKNSLTIFIHKMIQAIYKCENRYSRCERLRFLREFLLSERNIVRRCYFPGYKTDKIGKYLLLHTQFAGFDYWMCFLLKIKFKKMFGANY